MSNIIKSHCKLTKIEVCKFTGAVCLHSILVWAHDVKKQDTTYDDEIMK